MGIRCQVKSPLTRNQGANAEIGPWLNIKYGFNWASKKTIYGRTLVCHLLETVLIAQSLINFIDHL